MSSNTTAESIYFDLLGPFITRILTVGYFRNIVDFLTHVLMILTMAVVAWVCLRLRLRGTANHALFSTLGLFFLVGSAQLLTCHSCWLAGSSVGATLHAVLGALGLWTGSMGILAKILHKKEENKRYGEESQERHMNSKHSWSGLLGYLLLTFSFITGLSLLAVREEILLLCHRIFGLFGFNCLAISQWFSYNTVFARREWNWRWIQVLQVATLGATLLLCYEELFYIVQDFVTMVSELW
ncbi:hypothetical protein KR054_006655 [Drosophila jambulina]|nr:hypothetical protein KR054_006655 [Drosophila jambulina]